MCWTCGGYTPKLKVAKKDIPIFKIINYDLTSIYTDFKYKLSITYDTEMDNPIGEFYYVSIHKGFHSYSIKDVKTICCGRSVLDRRACVKNCMRILDVIDHPETRKKAYGIIPKGAQYYLNEDGEYVSDKIMLTNIRNL